MQEVIINAKERTLGRIATEAAVFLMGKKTAAYLPSAIPTNRVKVINLSQAKVTGKKMEQKKYKRHTGYPGSLKYIPLKRMMEKNPALAFKKIVKGMLPKNKLQKIMLKNLIIEI